jgi:hypothetical protein
VEEREREKMNDNKGYEEKVLIERVYKKVFESLLE